MKIKDLTEEQKEFIIKAMMNFFDASYFDSIEEVNYYTGLDTKACLEVIEAVALLHKLEF
jgi:hypothetical protein